MGGGPAEQGGEPRARAEARLRPLLREAGEDVVADEERPRAALLPVDEELIAIEIPGHPGVGARPDQERLPGQPPLAQALDHHAQVGVGVPAVPMGVITDRD